VPAVAAGLEDWVDFGVICGLLLLNAVVGFVQEYQAGSIVDELKKYGDTLIQSIRGTQLLTQLQDSCSQGCCSP